MPHPLSLVGIPSCPVEETAKIPVCTVKQFAEEHSDVLLEKWILVEDYMYGACMDALHQLQEAQRRTIGRLYDGRIIE